MDGASVAVADRPDSLPGQPGNRRGPGRPPGSPNKLTAEIKEALSKALRRAGGAKYLEELAKERPELFTQLLAKAMPANLNHDVGGEGGSISFIMQLAATPGAKQIEETSDADDDRD